MTSRYRHIIWDWNGTLFDDAWLCVEIINELLARRGMPAVDRASYEEQFTFPVKDYYRAVGFDFTRDPYEQLAVEFMKLYDRRWRECRLQPGAPDVLEALAARGLQQSILSACEQTRLNELITHTNLQGFFTRLLGMHHSYSTGKIELAQRFIAEADHRPAEMVLIGDSLHDAEVADAMGVSCVLIPGGYYSRARLSRNGNRVLDSLHEVLDLVR